MKIMTIAEAKKWCLIKWEFLAKTGDVSSEKNPRYKELERFPSECAFCYRSNQLNIQDGGSSCNNCPLEMDGGCCDGHYHEWLMNDDKKFRKFYAKKIVEMLKNITE